ncbi:uncharacterized protein LOC122512573 [Leptopilina heterotoma]|uniref:uncharacterized protein LOC122512573 n=1 Tax=Leptopilina heterotoma TaxID=63436 RepID=UPI001CA944EE|nr:uncharacterized protein LOC122512573 [Leptopilina heterotoma]
MDALLNGALGQIAGIALEKLRNSPRPKESDDIQRKYDALEAHFQGFQRVLKPAINLLIESKSADRAKSGQQTASSSVNYYTPQKQNNYSCSCRERNNHHNNNLPKVNKQFHSQEFHEVTEIKVPWRKCDACEVVSKFLIPTSCDHEICQKCVKSGRDCQKCLKSLKNIKREKF